MRELPENLAGCEVAQYRILGLIGRGGMGEVWEAEDTKLHRKVAIKRVRVDKLGDRQAARNLVDEARSASRISHPYIASVYDVLQEDSDPLIVMERVEGETLHEYLGHARPDPASVRRMGIQIAEALAAIHQAGLIHRDLKPANVMIASSGHAKLMDFGLSTGDGVDDAKSEIDPGAPTVTATALAAGKGTPTYMSPEQLRGLRPDRRSDLFALGIVLYESLTGEHPFRRATVADTMSSILNDEPAVLSAEERTADSHPIELIACRLLQKSPEDRFQSADAVVRTLREVKAPAVNEQRESNKYLAAASLLAVLALVVWLAFRGSTPTDPFQPIEVPGRDVLAILPIEDRTGDEDSPGGSAHGEMVASLIASYFDEASDIRPLSRMRIDELGLDSEGMTMTARVQRLRRALPTRWVVSGELFKDASDFVGTFDILDTRSNEHSRFSVSRPRLIHVAHAAYSELHRRIGVSGDSELQRAGSMNDDAQAAYERALRLRHDLEYTQALDVARRAVDLDHTFVRARLLVAEILNAMGYEAESNEEIQRLDTLLEDQPIELSETERLLIDGAIAEHAGAFDTAEMKYRKIVDRFPDSPRDLKRLAALYHRVADYDSALGLYESALLYDPMDPALHLSQASVLASAGRVEQAWEAAEQGNRLCELLLLRGCRGRVADARGALHYAEGNYELAAASYAEAADAYSAAGLHVNALLSTKSVADAELNQWQTQAALERVLRVREGIRDAGHFTLLTRTLSSLGAALFRARELGEAREVLLESVEVADELNIPSFEHTANLILANVSLHLGDMAAAETATQRSLAIARSMNHAYREQLSLLLLADCYRFSGQADKALALLGEGRASTIEGKNGLVIAGEAARRSIWIELARGHLDAADKAAREAVEHAIELGADTTLGYSLCLRAVALARQGDTVEAKQDLSLAEEKLQPFPDPVFKDSLAVARAAIALAEGDWQSALRVPASTGPTEEGMELLLAQAAAAHSEGRPELATQALERLNESPFPSIRQRARALRSMSIPTAVH